MFKHKKNEDHPKVVLETNGVIDISETGSECGDIEEEIDGETEIIENDCDEMIGNDCVNETFQNPSQVNIKSTEKLFKCETCDFETATKGDIVEHKKETHNWCSLCFSSFNSQDKLEEHVTFNH